MNAKTSKQILAEILTGQEQVNHAQSLHHTLTHQIEQAHSQRLKEVGQYILDASEGRLKQRKGGGSLKHVLWFLRDNLSAEVSNMLCRRLIQTVLDHPGWDLGFILPHLQDLPDFQPYLESLTKPTDQAELIKNLTFIIKDGYRVAVNTTAHNLNRPAFNSGADVVLAASFKGVMVMARRGLIVHGLAEDEGWVQKYPNYWHQRKRANGNDLWPLVDRIPKMLSPAP